MQNQESLVKDPKFLTPEYLATLQLKCGSGTGKEGDCCALQERRRWSGLDSKVYTVPETDSQTCGRFMIRFQDAIKDDATRNRLIPPLMVKLVGSAGSPELEQRRAWIAVDWALREVAPAYFDMAPELAIHAAALRALPPITCKADASAAFTVRGAARSAAWNLRQKKLAEFREKFRAELAKHPKLKDQPVVEAAAVAAVEAEAVAVVAVEAEAVAAAVAVGSPFYWEIRAAVREAVLKHLRESTNETTEKLRAIQRASWESGAKALERMLDCKEASAAA